MGGEDEWSENKLLPRLTDHDFRNCSPCRMLGMGFQAVKNVCSTSERVGKAFVQICVLFIS